MSIQTRERSRPVWGQVPHTSSPVAIPGLEPRGGGLLTLLADLIVIVLCYVAVRDWIAVQAGPEVPGPGWLPGGLLVGLWLFLGTWRTPHARFLGHSVVRGVAHVGWHYLQCLALTSLVVTVVPGQPPLYGALVAGIFLFGLAGLLIVRYAELTAVTWARMSTRQRLRILFVGNNPRTREMLIHVRENPHLRVEVVGLLDPIPEEGNPAHAVNPRDVPYLGSLDKLPTFLYHGQVDEVVITLPVRSQYHVTEQVLQACSEAGIRAHVFSDVFNLGESRREVSALGRRPTVAYARGPARTYRLAIKRQIDMILSLLALVALSPLMAAIALAIKITSTGPVLFQQTRSGLNGRLFQVLKFRTMCVDAEARKDALLARNEVSGPVFKMRVDPRITRVGRFLRKYSLDELPQLFNVLRGDMSLVGPRPPIPEEVQKYDFWQLRRLSMRPGITCIWQVSGRNKIAFEEWMRLDLRYIDNWSLSLDFLILMRTIPAVLRGSGY